jgi:predicted AAA+ superfamily ATPase
VWDQRLVHNLEPFRKFLEVAAQSNGTIINYSKMARQTGVDDKTIKKYFEVLADTFLGFYLESYSRSVRAQQIQSPKFYCNSPGATASMPRGGGIGASPILVIISPIPYPFPICYDVH